MNVDVIIIIGTYLSSFVIGGHLVFGQDRDGSPVWIFSNMPTANRSTINNPIIIFSSIFKLLYKNCFCYRRAAYISYITPKLNTRLCYQSPFYTNCIKCCHVKKKVGLIGPRIPGANSTFGYWPRPLGGLRGRAAPTSRLLTIDTLNQALTP